MRSLWTTTTSTRRALHAQFVPTVAFLVETHTSFDGSKRARRRLLRVADCFQPGFALSLLFTLPVHAPLVCCGQFRSLFQINYLSYLLYRYELKEYHHMRVFPNGV